MDLWLVQGGSYRQQRAHTGLAESAHAVFRNREGQRRTVDLHVAFCQESHVSMIIKVASTA